MESTDMGYRLTKFSPRLTNRIKTQEAKTTLTNSVYQTSKAKDFPLVMVWYLPEKQNRFPCMWDINKH